MKLPRPLYDELFAAAFAASPREAVGFLFGRGDRAARFVPLPNDWPEPDGYRVPPEARRAALAEAKRRGEELLAEVHSHPTDLPVPSTLDLAGAKRNSVHLIVSLAPVPAARAYRIFDGQALPEPIEIE